MGRIHSFPFADLLRQSVYSRLAGYEDVNDAERLCHDSAFRLIGSEKVWDRGAALTSRLQIFETDMLAEDENFAGLGRFNRALICKAETMDSGYQRERCLRSGSEKRQVWAWGFSGDVRLTRSVVCGSTRR